MVLVEQGEHSCCFARSEGVHSLFRAENKSCSGCGDQPPFSPTFPSASHSLPWPEPLCVCCVFMSQTHVDNGTCRVIRFCYSEVGLVVESQLPDSARSSCLCLAHPHVHIRSRPRHNAAFLLCTAASGEQQFQHGTAAMMETRGRNQSSSNEKERDTPGYVQHSMELVRQPGDSTNTTCEMGLEVLQPRSQGVLDACRPQGQDFLGVRYVARGVLTLTFYITL